MTTGQAAMRMGVVLISVGVMLIGAGCAAKRVASTSGDQSETMKGKGKAAGAAENVKEEPLASVDSSLSTEFPARTARSCGKPLDARERVHPQQCGRARYQKGDGVRCAGYDRLGRHLL